MLIAEIGVNHLGKIKIANNFVKRLIKTKVDAITFQIPSSDTMDKLQINNLPEIFYIEKIKEIKKAKKKVGIAISDENFVNFFNKQKIDFWKVLSVDFHNKNLINNLKKTNKLIYLSTGFSSTKEIIDIKKISSKIKFIHTNLSHDISDTNLSAISNLQKITNRKIAYGLHCDNHNVLYASVTYNPESIFFYVKNTMLKTIYDDKHAIDLNELNTILKNLIGIKKSLGNSKKIKQCMKNPTAKIK
jgi:sialic acid synthase SpsE